MTTFTNIADILDTIQDDTNVIGSVFAHGCSEPIIIDGVAVFTDWDGNDVYINPISNKIVGYQFQGCILQGVDTSPVLAAFSLENFKIN